MAKISPIPLRLFTIDRRPIIRPQFFTWYAQLLLIKDSTAGAYIPSPGILLVESIIGNPAHLGCCSDG